MESFTLLLQSANTNNQSGTSVYNLTYNVNWDAIIPPIYRNRRFKLSFTFVSNLYTGTSALNDLYLLSVNFNGHSNTYDQSSQNSNIIGHLFRQGNLAPYTYYLADAKTNNPTICTYPSSNIINVAMYLNATYNTLVSAATFTNYSLFLNFELLPEK